MKLTPNGKQPRVPGQHALLAELADSSGFTKGTVGGDGELWISWHTHDPSDHHPRRQLGGSALSRTYRAIYELNRGRS